MWHPVHLYGIHIDRYRSYLVSTLKQSPMDREKSIPNLDPFILSSYVYTRHLIGQTRTGLFLWICLFFSF